MDEAPVATGWKVGFNRKAGMAMLLVRSPALPSGEVVVAMPRAEADAFARAILNLPPEVAN